MVYDVWTQACIQRTGTVFYHAAHIKCRSSDEYSAEPAICNLTRALTLDQLAESILNHHGMLHSIRDDYLPPFTIQSSKVPQRTIDPENSRTTIIEPLSEKELFDLEVAIRKVYEQKKKSMSHIC